MRNYHAGLLALIIIILIALFGSVYTVGQAQTALLLEYGKIQQSHIKPGLHFKLPFVENVRKFDRRLLTLDGKPEHFLTLNKKNVLVDFYVKWRIVDAVVFYQAIGGRESRALQRLSDIVSKVLRSEFGQRTVNEVVSGERKQIMQKAIANADKQVQNMGIQIVDVRIKRIDLPDKVAGSVYNRMRSERERIAAKYRAEGAAKREKIKANADKQKTVILANAYEKAQKLRGEGDAVAAKIYAKAYRKDPKFYAFYRSLNAYKASFSNPSDVLVLNPKGEFFKYFNPGK